MSDIKDTLVKFSQSKSSEEALATGADGSTIHFTTDKEIVLNGSRYTRTLEDFGFTVNENGELCQVLEEVE